MERTKLEWERIGELTEEATKMPGWIVPGLMLAGTATVLGAESKVGKSWLSIDLALAVASGGEWLGRKVAQRPVLYVAAEGGLTWPDRMRTLASARGVNPEDVEFAVVRSRAAICTSLGM